jgi:hypothetical protein
MHIYDAMAPRGQKLVASFDTPTIHRWRCEAHVSGFILVENNCMCCSSCLYTTPFKAGKDAISATGTLNDINDLTLE